MTPSKLRVLLVTDTDKPIGDLREALARLGYEMLAEAATPQALPEVVESERPDVIIIDTESPSRDTLEQLAVMNETAPRPVLMFSNDANQQLIRDAVERGRDGLSRRRTRHGAARADPRSRARALCAGGTVARAARARSKTNSPSAR